MTTETRQNEVKGSLDARVLALENSLLNRWENWFGKNPGTVLGIVVVALTSGFWVYHTWQIERNDKQYEKEITRILEENESKIKWLKEQQEAKVVSENDKCDIEKKQLSLELESCRKDHMEKEHNNAPKPTQ
jgi:hypothetical protein